ncbi:hypothetical protein D3C80_1292190 [compost metagenome]
MHQQEKERQVAQVAVQEHEELAVEKRLGQGAAVVEEQQQQDDRRQQAGGIGKVPRRGEPRHGHHEKYQNERQRHQQRQPQHQPEHGPLH